MLSARGLGPSLRPLRHRAFRLIWCGQAVSLLGDGVTTLALTWQVLAISNGPTALAVVGGARSAAFVLSLLFSGHLCARFGELRLMIGADVVRCTTLIAIAALVLSGGLEPVVVVPIAIIYGAASAQFSPAFTTLVPTIVAPDELLAANALDQTVRPLAVQIIGPALGGALVAIDAALAFSIDAASFCVSAVTLGVVDRSRSQRQTKLAGKASTMRGAVVLVARTRWIWLSATTGAVSSLVLSGPYEVLLPYIAREELGATPAVLGGIVGAGGVGAIVGGASLAARTRVPRALCNMYRWSAGLAMSFIGFGLAQNLWELVALNVIFGACVAGTLILWFTALQTYVHERLLSHVVALDYLIGVGLAPLSYAFAAGAAQVAGARAALIGAGVVIGVPVLLVPHIHGATEATAVSAP